MTKNHFSALVLCLFCFRAAAQDIHLDALRPLQNPALAPFYYGVASGDPAPDAIALWTKVAPAPGEVVATLEWQLAEDEQFLKIVQQGQVETISDINWAVNVHVGGLKACQFYYYRFAYQGKYSRTGRTKTAPLDAVQQLRIGVTSCANHQASYFNAYAQLARRDDVDVVLHLGDYIYEYQPGGYGNSQLAARAHIPAKEIVSLDDYRARYAQYRLDPDLQELHARFPVIMIWDDHEFANDAYVDGAQNHQPDKEGAWQARKQAARQAYFEWMPIRPEQAGKLYRSFSFGPLAELWMLDERMEGRSKQVKSAADSMYHSPTRSMLGQGQFEWLTNGLEQSQARWRLIGNQVIMSSLDGSKVLPQNPKFMDMWDGYPAERERLFRFFEAKNMKNLVVLTGDCHTTWAMDLTRAPNTPGQYARKSRKNVVGIEYTTPSITSANYDEYAKRWKVRIGQKRFKKGGLNPHVRVMDLMHHGYLLLTLSQESARADWYFVRKLSVRDQREYRGRKWVYRVGK